jgi:adenylate kinase family enzyme
MKRIMIFGRSGSGKSTFAIWLAQKLDLPLHHLDKHFYQENWIERDYFDFLAIQQNIVDGDEWIVDGNSTRSIEMRWSRADLVIYFNFSRIICYWRILKRFFWPNKSFDDRAPGCDEKITWSLLKYIWRFEKRVAGQLALLKESYPEALFREIKNADDLKRLKSEFENQIKSHDKQ